MPRSRDTAGRYLPSIERLQRMEVGELAETLRRFGHPVDEAQLREIALRAVERLARAPNPTPAVLAQAEQRILRAMQQQLAIEAKKLVRTMELRAQGLWGRSGASEARAIWIAVLVGSCPDCVDRHGEEHTMREWAGLGLPGSESILCRQHCRCYLAPVDMFEGEPEDEGDIKVRIELEIERD